MQKKTKKIRFFTILLSLSLLCGILALPTAAQTVSTKPNTVTNTTVTSYASIPIHLPNGTKLEKDGKLIESTTYVPLRAALKALLPQANLTYSAASRTASVSGEGLTMEASDRSHILYANGRCLYTDMPIRILSDGTMYLPIRLLAKALSLTVEWHAASRSVTLAGKTKPILDGNAFYDDDAVYWLARIISAEARGEPFIGQVAVGNVVLNRVAHKEFPNTIYGVIFDKRAGIVQFSPVEDGSIWQKPTASSVTAAKVCLEGYTVSNRILFFYAPSMVTHTWISKNRPYAFTIAGHRFYN